MNSVKFNVIRAVMNIVIVPDGAKNIKSAVEEIPEFFISGFYPASEREDIDRGWANNGSNFFLPLIGIFLKGVQANICYIYVVITLAGKCPSRSLSLFTSLLTSSFSFLKSGLCLLFIL